MPPNALIAGPQVGIDVLCFERPFVQRPSPAPKQPAIAVHKVGSAEPLTAPREGNSHQMRAAGEVLLKFSPIVEEYFSI
jgi:hypothetical protein